jgi:undecaprenyl-diphosphatase
MGARRRRSSARLLPRSVVALVAAAAALALIHLGVVQSGAPWEHHVLLSLHRVATGAPWLQVGSYQISRLGYPSAVIPVGAVVVVWWLLFRRGWKAAVFIADTLVLTAIDYGAKPLFARPRPELFPHPFVHGASYPSGHALFGVGYYGMIVYLGLLGARPGLRTAGWVLWVLFALGIGFSRLVLGVHWPTDIIAGYVAGLIVLLIEAPAAARR